MNIEVRGETVFISGYVNAVERYSKPITSTLRGKIQTFIEKVRAGTFGTSLKRNNEVRVLLNHDINRELANTKDGTAKLEEDNIGLRAEVTINDKEVVDKAKQNKLVGWSFGFFQNADEIGTDGKMTTRTLTDLDLIEVSILDDTRSPAYNGTSIETRSKGGRIMEIREEAIVNEEPTNEGEAVVNIEELATVVAQKVVELLNAPKEEKAEEEPKEEEATEEETTEEETTEEPKEEEPTEKPEEEKRAIDYSAFESRLANL